jgi:hypothetical protein
VLQDIVVLLEYKDTKDMTHLIYAVELDLLVQMAIKQQDRIAQSVWFLQ